jgi:hypothetical protein
MTRKMCVGLSQRIGQHPDNGDRGHSLAHPCFTCYSLLCTAAAQPHSCSQAGARRCMMEACCSGRGPVNGTRYDVQTRTWQRVGATAIALLWLQEARHLL